MNILFVSKELNGGNLSNILQQEGNSLKLYIEDEKQKRVLNNIVPKTDDWEKELDWVGKNGLIVFDDTGYGKRQDELRKEGYNVFGGSELGEKIELDRFFANTIFHKYGLPTTDIISFSNLKDAVDYMKKNPASWVTKQDDAHYPKTLNYVGKFDNGHDVIDLLETYCQSNNTANRKITIQKRLKGIEIGVGRYFNGNDWVGPLEVNLEHPYMFGHKNCPCVDEMGTLAWFEKKPEKNKLYMETMAKLKPFLIEADFRGDISLNCIITEEGPFILEATARIGSPIVHLQEELQTVRWTDLLISIAKGEQIDVTFKKGFGVVTLIATPPYPYEPNSESKLLEGAKIYLDDLTEEERKSIHLGDVAMREVDGEKILHIQDCTGYIAYVTSVHKNISKARKRIDSIINKIHIPRMFYRDDIGLNFEKEERKKLKKLGYFKRL